ncbi:MAG: type VI secretion system baseplate subunit TssE [Rhodocyclaceae bacterium]|jgi:type VI secretion system protein ImpF
MPELIALERLQPSLLDRLTDDDRQNTREPLERHVFSIRRLRESVLRDLGWLLNTTATGQPRNAEAYPEAAASVINYGIVDLAGITSSSIEAAELARLVREAIVRFEPRILSESLRVEVVKEDEAMSHNTLRMQIEGEMWAVPAPLHILVNTAFDLESGRVMVTDTPAG